MAELHPIGTHRLDAKGDVVFVHGLHGGWRTTWLHETGGCWPEWLASDLPINVWSLEYEASPSRWLGQSITKEHRDNILLTEFEACGIGERPFILIAHSMGGLAIKELLRLGHELGDERWRQLVSCCRGAVFIATPHDGARLANYISALAKVFPLRATDALKGLQANTQELLRLTQWYRNNARHLGIDTLPFYEVQNTRGVRIVDETTADPKIERIVPRAIDADHIGIAKPVSRNAALYKLVLRFVQKSAGVNKASFPELQTSSNQPSGPKLCTLPTRVDDFTGRERELNQLSKLLRTGGRRAAFSATIVGMGGVGKTTLALEAAWRVADHFPDGMLFVDLLGFRHAPMPADQAIRQILWAFDPLADLREERARLLARYKRALAGKRLLLILDNAKDAMHLADLLPPEPVTVLITSRRRMALPGAVSFELDVLSEAEAVAFLIRIIQNVDQDQLQQLATACGHLPLALRAAGSYLRETGCPVDDYLAELYQARLGMLSADRELDDELHVEAVLAFSIDRLLEEDRALATRYVQLSVFPADTDLAAMAAVWDVDERTARRSIDRLVARSLVERDAVSGRFRLHDLLRDLAISRMVATA